MTYPAVDEFFKKHVVGNTPIDYNIFFAKTGIVSKIKTVDTKYFIDNGGQPFISVNKNRELFFTKRTNTALTSLGVKTGDLFKKVNGEAITLQNANQILLKSFEWVAGDKVTLEVVRDGKELKLEGVYNCTTNGARRFSY